MTAKIDTDSSTTPPLAAVRSDALLAAWQSYCGNSDSMYPCENFKAGWKAGRMDMEGITEQDIAETMPPNSFG